MTEQRGEDNQELGEGLHLESTGMTSHIVVQKNFKTICSGGDLALKGNKKE